ncbi:hypothetical protein HOK51_03620 [Candidatus Woesearchaeota archaeon]|jgi:phosphoribosylaminoimidazole-succinocarboxamide synthase|nr:hypothetical protein [Candidatus Woesearchaeota archaeon]MBT6518910.1 hypothetical protein [Candidatus Woesearchaeota archaeon]MBT7367578.1 hypothetical protein [Candidatus Woesearchaeota archaeon]
MQKKQLNQIKQVLKTLNIKTNLEKSKEQGLVCSKNSLFENIRNIVEYYVQENLNKVNFKKPFIEGESKKFFEIKSTNLKPKIALIELKPTMYSFTYNRYGVVEHTDILRLKFWRLFASMLNNNVSNHVTKKKQDKLITKDAEKLIPKNFPFISNYLGQTIHKNKTYAIVFLANSIPPLEIIWKNYLVGTMKHNLKTVDQHKTKLTNKKITLGKPINYESKFPKDIIRFDWRNPLPDKDECIPDEFAEFYINTSTARSVARMASLMLNRLLQSKGYELVDLCYFMNYSGTRIHSEITPDGMRIKQKQSENQKQNKKQNKTQKQKSFDKDLWRQGKDKDTIVRVWSELFEDLSN